MAKLNINAADTKDLISQSKNLTLERKKESQIARLYIDQGKLPVYHEGVSGKFVMMDNVAFKSTSMQEPAFLTGILRAGAFVGISEQDIADTYDSGENAMALCNYIQEQIMNNFQNASVNQIKIVADRIETDLEIFGKSARNAEVDLGVIISVEQQVKKDLENIRELAAQKEEDNINEK